MTSSIEPIIQEAVGSGRLKGLTLFPTPDGRWQASATEDRLGWRVEINADPLEAIRRALSGLTSDVAGGMFE